MKFNHILSKKANISVVFLLLLIFTMATLLFVSYLLAGATRSLLPGEDSNTEKNFELLHKLIATKAATSLEYDSVTTNVYLKEDYRLFVFGKADESYCLDDEGLLSSTTPKKPKECEGKPCICLSDSGEDDFDDEKGIFKPLLCKTFDNDFNLLVGKTQVQCKTDSQYQSLIIAKDNYKDATGSRNYIYIMKNTEENRAFDAEQKIPRCGLGVKTKDLCYGMKDGDVISADNLLTEDDRLLSKNMVNYCKEKYNQTSFGGTCIYSQELPTQNKCYLNCDIDNDFAGYCKKEKCEDLNSMGDTIKYVLPEHYSGEFCLNHEQFCGENAKNLYCGGNYNDLKPFDVYISDIYLEGNVYVKESIAGEQIKYNITVMPSDTDRDKFNSECNPEVKFYNFNGESKAYLYNYASGNEFCDSVITKHFKKTAGFYLCNTDECKKIIKEKKDVCSILVLKNSRGIALLNEDIILYYDKAQCADLSTTIIEIKYCTTI